MTALPAVLVPTSRTLPLAATAAGITLTVAATVADVYWLVELRNAAVMLACTLPLSVDDAGASLTAATPVPLWQRTLHRLGPPGVVMALVWGALLLAGDPDRVTALWLTLELVGLTATGLAVAAVRARAGAGSRAGLAGAATAFTLAAFGAFLPDRFGLWPALASTGWVAIHLVWAAVAVGATGVLLHALRDPARP